MFSQHVGHNSHGGGPNGPQTARMGDGSHIGHHSQPAAPVFEPTSYESRGASNHISHHHHDSRYSGGQRATNTGYNGWGGSSPSRYGRNWSLFSNWNTGPAWYLPWTWGRGPRAPRQAGNGGFGAVFGLMLGFVALAVILPSLLFPNPYYAAAIGASSVATGGLSALGIGLACAFTAAALYFGSKCCCRRKASSEAAAEKADSFQGTYNSFAETGLISHQSQQIEAPTNSSNSRLAILQGRPVTHTTSGPVVLPIEDAKPEEDKYRSQYTLG